MPIIHNDVVRVNRVYNAGGSVTTTTSSSSGTTTSTSTHASTPTASLQAQTSESLSKEGYSPTQIATIQSGGDAGSPSGTSLAAQTAEIKAAASQQISSPTQQGGQNLNLMLMGYQGKLQQIGVASINKFEQDRASQPQQPPPISDRIDTSKKGGAIGTIFNIATSLGKQTQEEGVGSFKQNTGLLGGLSELNAKTGAAGVNLVEAARTKYYNAQEIGSDWLAGKVINSKAFGKLTSTKNENAEALATFANIQQNKWGGNKGYEDFAFGVAKTIVRNPAETAAWYAGGAVLGAAFTGIAATSKVAAIGVNFFGTGAGVLWGIGETGKIMSAPKEQRAEVLAESFTKSLIFMGGAGSGAKFAVERLGFLPKPSYVPKFKLNKISYDVQGPKGATEVVTARTLSIEVPATGKGRDIAYIGLKYPKVSKMKVPVKASSQYNIKLDLEKPLYKPTLDIQGKFVEKVPRGIYKSVPEGEAIKVPFAEARTGIGLGTPRLISPGGGATLSMKSLASGTAARSILKSSESIFASPKSKLTPEEALFVTKNPKQEFTTEYQRITGGEKGKGTYNAPSKVINPFEKVQSFETQKGFAYATKELGKLRTPIGKKAAEAYGFGVYKTQIEGPTRASGDIDVALFKSGEQTKALAERLAGTLKTKYGEQSFYKSSEPYLVQTKTAGRSHQLDLHPAGEQLPGQAAPESFYGVPYSTGTKTIVTKPIIEPLITGAKPLKNVKVDVTLTTPGATIQGKELAFGGLGKASSIYTLRTTQEGEFYFAPQTHRVKDIMDYAVAQKQLSKNIGKTFDTASFEARYNPKVLEANVPEVKSLIPSQAIYKVSTSPIPSFNFITKPSPISPSPSLNIQRDFLSARIPSPSASRSSPIPSSSRSPSPNISRSLSASPSISASLSPSPSASPSQSPSPSPSLSPSLSPSRSPSPSMSKYFSPSQIPSMLPKVLPPQLGFGGPGGFGRGKFKLPTKYKYSLRAKVYNVKVDLSKRQETALNKRIFSGLELRPVIA